MKKHYWLLNTPIAHRGLHNHDNNIPENSIPAFEEALNANYPIELDVRILKDNTVVVFHDSNTERLTNKNIHVEEADFNELNRLNLLGTNIKIPSLPKVLEFLDSKAPVLIELKNENNGFRLENEVLKIISWYKGEIAVQSFNPYSMLWFKNNAPAFPRGQISSDFTEVKLKRHVKFILRNMLYNFRIKPDFVTYDIRALPNRRVTGLRKTGIPVIAWTIRNNSDLEKAHKYSDNFIFENFRL